MLSFENNCETYVICYERETQTKDHANYIINTAREKATVTGFANVPSESRVLYSRKYSPASSLLSLRNDSALIIQRHVRGWLARRYVKMLTTQLSLARESAARHMMGATILIEDNDSRIILSGNALIELENVQQERFRYMLRTLRQPFADARNRLLVLDEVKQYLDEIECDGKILKLLDREIQYLKEGSSPSKLSGLHKRIIFHFGKLLRQ